MLGPWGEPGRGVSAPQGGFGAPWGGVPGGDPPDGYCCGRYASYWNAFLLNVSVHAKVAQVASVNVLA